MAMLWAFGGVFFTVMPVIGVLDAAAVFPARSLATASRSYRPSGVAWVAVFQLHVHGDAVEAHAVDQGLAEPLTLYR